jgi:hypothetical protein
MCQLTAFRDCRDCSSRFMIPVSVCEDCHRTLQSNPLHCWYSRGSSKQGSPPRVCLSMEESESLRARFVLITGIVTAACYSSFARHLRQLDHFEPVRPFFFTSSNVDQASLVIHYANEEETSRSSHTLHSHRRFQRSGVSATIYCSF